MRKTIISAALAVGVVTVGIAAQGDPNGNPNAPGNPNILQAIQQQTTILQTIQTTLQGLIPAVSSVAVTPGFETNGDASATCNYVNRLAGTTVVVELVNQAGAVEASETFSIGANSVGVSRSLTNSNIVYCRFTVTNGTKADIVASGVFRLKTGQIYAQDAK